MVYTYCIIKKPIIKQKGLNMNNITFSNRMLSVEGSAIREILELLVDESIISLAGGNPSKKTFPKQEIAAITQSAIQSQGDRILQYGETMGWRPLRETIVELLKTRGINQPFDNIMITTGSSQGIELATKIFVNSGETILCEDPTFLGALQTFKSFGANVIGIEMDEEGINVIALENEIKKSKPKFLYLIPNFQNPTGKTMSLKRREAVLEIANKYDLLIIEDDPYGELIYDGETVPPIKSLPNSENVIYLGSFSKTISPGLRVGFVCAGDPIVAKMQIAKQGIDTHTSNLSQAIIDEFYRQDKYFAHVEGLCKFYKASKDTMLDSIAKYFPENIEHTNPNGGLFLWVSLPKNINAGELFQTSVEKKVAFVPGTYFYANGGHDEDLRLNFSMPDPEQIKKGIEILGNLIKARL